MKVRIRELSEDGVPLSVVCGETAIRTKVHTAASGVLDLPENIVFKNDGQPSPCYSMPDGSDIPARELPLKKAKQTTNAPA